MVEKNRVWSKIENKFKGFPSRQKVVKRFLELGISVEKHKLWLEDIELSVTKIARALGVDRKVILNTIEVIEKDPKLKRVFSQLKSVCHIGQAAKIFNYGVIEVYSQPENVGIIAEITKHIARANIVIRQIIADDPDLSVDPKVTIITEKKLPGDLVEKLVKSKIVKKIIIS